MVSATGLRSLVITLAGILITCQPVIAADQASWTEGLPFSLTGEVELGGQTLSGDTASPTLREYRDLDGKPTIPRLRLLAEDELSTRFLELGGTNLTRTDGFYFLRGGLYNRVELDFTFNRQPHVLGLDRFTIFDEPDRGRFTLPSDPAIANAFNAVPATDPANRDAIEATVNRLLRPTELEFQTDTAGVGISGLPLPNLELRAGYSRMEKDGRVPLGGVIGSPGSNLVEMPAPRKERSHEVHAGAEYAQDWYQVRVGYHFSMFENDVNQYEWDWVCGTGPDCGNPSGFGRTSVMPDNFAHQFSASGGVTLPWWRTRVTGTGSFSLWRQDETFLPWTTVPGFTGNSTDAGATSPNAAMNVSLANIRLTTQPLPKLTGTLRYRYYQLDNDTPIHTFTDTLSPGDQAPGAGIHRSLPIGFQKQNASANLVWRLLPEVTAKAGYEWEQWDRAHREVDVTNEHIAKGSLNIRPTGWMTSRLTYAHRVRTFGAGGYTPLQGAPVDPTAPLGNTILPQFRKFDQADRTRDTGEVFLQVTPVANVTVSGSFFGQLDNYFDSEFGVQDSTAFGWSVDAAWTPIGRLEVFAGYAHDDYQTTQKNCEIPFAFPFPTECDLANTFFSRPRDILDTLHTGLNVTAIPEVLFLSLSYRYTFGQSKIGSSGVPGGLASGEPASFPDIDNIFHVISVGSRYHFAPHWALNLAYRYERYTETDFTTDDVPESLANFGFNGFQTASASDIRTVLIPVQHPDFEAHIVTFSTSYTF